MERIDYEIYRLPYEAVIALGSCEPLKKWCKLKFSPKGDVYLYHYLWNVRDEDKNAWHDSIHKKSNEIHTRIDRRVDGKLETLYLGKGHHFLDKSGKLTEMRNGNTRLEEDYLYRWLPTLTEGDKRQQKGKTIIACSDKLLVNSFLAFSIVGFVVVGSEQAAAAINSYLEGEESRTYAYVFHLGWLSLIVCICFSGGDKSIDKTKQ
ncbi:hypothetical protein ACFLVS_06550, partial [Chloroflexota bacterium]